ncbi:hypothetical protein GCM10010193_24940 [Kitasatospora atroaurantiaca]
MRVAGSVAVGHTGHAGRTRGTEPPEAPSHRTVGDAENVSDLAERGPSVELERVQKQQVVTRDLDGLERTYASFGVCPRTR